LKWPKIRHLGTIATTLSGYIFATEARIDNQGCGKISGRKKEIAHSDSGRQQIGENWGLPLKCIT